MRIESFWAKGYRSLRDVRIDNLGAFNVFYGPNGGGKSNILEGIRTLIELARVSAQNPSAPHKDSISQSQLISAGMAIKSGIIARRDLCAYDPSRTIVLG